MNSGIVAVDQDEGDEGADADAANDAGYLFGDCSAAGELASVDDSENDLDECGCAEELDGKGVGSFETEDFRNCGWTGRFQIGLNFEHSNSGLFLRSGEERMKLKRKLALLTLFVVLLGTAWLYIRGYAPGSIRQQPNGEYFGTGEVVYRYANGAVKVSDRYLAGKLQRSIWHRPDGSMIAETRWGPGENVGYYLRDDGTIRVKMRYRGEVAHGKALYFKEDGVTVDREQEFREGKEVK